MSRGNSGNQQREVNQGGGASFLCTPWVKPGLLPQSHGVLAAAQWKCQDVGRYRQLPTSKAWQSTSRPNELLLLYSPVFEEQGILKRRYNANLISSNFLLFKIEQKEYWISSTYQSSCSLWHLFSSWNISVNSFLLTCSSLAMLPRVSGKKNTQGNTGLRSRWVHTSSYS